MASAWRRRSRKPRAPRPGADRAAERDPGAPAGVQVLLRLPLLAAAVRDRLPRRHGIPARRLRPLPSSPRLRSNLRPRSWHRRRITGCSGANATRRRCCGPPTGSCSRARSSPSRSSCSILLVGDYLFARWVAIFATAFTALRLRRALVSAAAPPADRATRTASTNPGSASRGSRRAGRRRCCRRRRCRPRARSAWPASAAASAARRRPPRRSRASSSSRTAAAVASSERDCSPRRAAARAPTSRGGAALSRRRRRTTACSRRASERRARARR